MSATPPPAVLPPWKAYVGSVGVFLGAGTVSLGQRVLGIGLPDLRGALGLGVDQGAWIPTAQNMALMFMGAFTVYLGGLFGPRRVLLLSGLVSTLTSIALPFARSYSLLLALQVIAGLSSGTFYPLSMSFAARALPMRLAVYVVGAYALDLLGSLSLATPLLGWFIAHWSWRWIFWHNAVLVPGMMICVYVAIPPKPKPTGPIPAAPRVSWQGFFYASLGLSLLLGALEQGERLDWLRSGLFVSMVSAGAMLLLAAVVRRIIAPNRMVDLGFLATRNTLILGTSLFSLRFVLLGVISLIPAYLGLLQRYRPEQTGVVLLWLLVPQTLMGFVAVRLMRRLDTRLIPAAGFGTVAIACLMDARLTSDWANVNFWWPQIVMAAGLAFTFAGVVGMIIEQAVASGAVSRPVELLTYAAFFQVIRLFGGNVGAATLTRFLFVRERFHSSVLNGGLEAGYALTDERLRALATGLYPGSSGSDESQARAIASLAGQVTRQAYTLTYADGFMFLAWICAASLVALACTTATRLYLDAAPAVRTSGS